MSQRDLLRDQVARAGLNSARARLNATIAEKDLQADVLHLARLMSWRCFHAFDSRRSEPGWPDLAMVRGTRLVLAELKREGGKPTEQQEEWLADLARVETVETFLWRPSSWLDIERILGRLA